MSNGTQQVDPQQAAGMLVGLQMKYAVRIGRVIASRTFLVVATIIAVVVFAIIAMAAVGGVQVTSPDPYLTNTGSWERSRLAKDQGAYISTNRGFFSGYRGRDSEKHYSDGRVASDPYTSKQGGPNVWTFQR